MMWLLAILAGVAGPASDRATAMATAEARVVVIRPHRASAEDWGRGEGRGEGRHRREVVKMETEGPVRLRLTEYE